MNRSCVESDYPKRQTLCPMYMTFLKTNIERSPCQKHMKMMKKVCRQKGGLTKRPGNAQINSICSGAMKQLKQCVQETKDGYMYMDFWRKYDGTKAPM